MNVPLLEGFLDVIFHDLLLSKGYWINVVLWGCGIRQEVIGTIFRSVRQHAGGLDFAEHLTEVMIYFWDVSGDRCVTWMQL